MDLSDPLIKSTCLKITKGTDGLNWAIFGYVDNVMPPKIKLIKHGTGPLAELRTQLSPDEVQYAYLQVQVLPQGASEAAATSKFIFITYVTSKVNPLKRARVSVHKTIIAKYLPVFHVELFAERLEDLEDDKVVAHFGKGSSGWHLSKRSIQEANAFGTLREANVKYNDEEVKKIEEMQATKKEAAKEKITLKKLREELEKKKKADADAAAAAAASSSGTSTASSTPAPSATSASPVVPPKSPRPLPNAPTQTNGHSSATVASSASKSGASASLTVHEEESVQLVFSRPAAQSAPTMPTAATLAVAKSQPAASSSLAPPPSPSVTVTAPPSPKPPTAAVVTSSPAPSASAATPVPVVTSNGTLGASPSPSLSISPPGDKAPRAASGSTAVLSSSPAPATASPTVGSPAASTTLAGHSAVTSPAAARNASPSPASRLGTASGPSSARSSGTSSPSNAGARSASPAPTGSPSSALHRPGPARPGASHNPNTHTAAGTLRPSQLANLLPHAGGIRAVSSAPNPGAEAEAERLRREAEAKERHEKERLEREKQEKEKREREEKERIAERDRLAAATNNPSPGISRATVAAPPSPTLSPAASPNVGRSSLGASPSSAAPAKPPILGVGEGATQGVRRDMEDKHVALTSLPTEPSYGFGAVYDGHGGVAAAEFCRVHLHKHVLADPLFKTDLPKAMWNGFLKTDEEFKKVCVRNRIEAGCTACTVVVTPNKIVCGNAGDSRAILSRKGLVVPLSRDHKPYDASERKRIEKAGSRVEDNRVDGRLAVSRAIGDFDFKRARNTPPEDQPVSPAPEVLEEDRSPDDEYIVIACDGLWDILENESVLEFISTRLDCMTLREIAQELVEYAVEIGSMDNVSCVILQLKK